MSARKTYTASEAIRVDQLRAEARAWRRRARECDRWHLTMNGTTDMRGMQSRVLQHVLVAVFVANERDAPWTVDSRVLACLFLALECEDEARALGRGGR